MLRWSRARGRRGTLGVFFDFHRDRDRLPSPNGVEQRDRGGGSGGGRGTPSTPLQQLRDSMRGAVGSSISGFSTAEGRLLVNNMRKRIVENFQERMQLRRSLIELEDQTSRTASK